MELPGPVAAILFSMLLVNARHVLMGASLAPKTRGFSFAQCHLDFFFLTDQAWALAERRALAKSVTPAYWFACAATLLSVWMTDSPWPVNCGWLVEFRAEAATQTAV